MEKQNKAKDFSLKIYENNLNNDGNIIVNIKNIEEKEDSIITNNATCSSGRISNSSFNNSQIVNIKLFYYINKDLKTTEILIQEDKTINELISFALNIINEELICDNMNIQLDSSSIKNYSIILIKKKEDIKSNKNQALNPDSLINNYINNENIYFLKWLDNKKSNLIPYLRKNKSEYNIKMNNNIIINKEIIL